VHLKTRIARLMNRTVPLPFYYGWVILGVSSLAAFVSGPGQTFTFSIFVEPLRGDLGWSQAMVTGLYTAGSLTAGLAMVPIGRMLDRYGSRVLLTITGLLFGLATLLMSWVSHPAHLYFGYAAMRALANGTIPLIASTLVATWFVRLRGRAMIVTRLGEVGAAAALPPLVYWLITSYGWRNAWIVLAFGIWILIVPAGFLLARRSPESVGLLPDGDAVITDGEKVDGTLEADPETQWTLSEALRTRTLWLLLLSQLSAPLIMTGLTFNHVSIMETKGISAATAAIVLSIQAPVGLGGVFLAGYLSDRFDNRYLLIAAQAGLALAMVWTFVISGPWQAYIYGAILGLSGSISMIANAVIWPNYFGRRYIGSIRGVSMTAMVAFAALGPWPFGLIFTLTGSYDLVMTLFLALPCACAVSAFLARRPVKLSSV
jgi:MFS family permease